MTDENTRCLQLAKKCPKITLGAISFFFGSKTPYRKQDEAHKLFLEDLMLFIVKKIFSLEYIIRKDFFNHDCKVSKFVSMTFT
jgi:hypothetical protein